MTTPIPPIYATIETTTGTHGPCRVLAVDKIATEQTCRRYGYDFADGPRTHTLMAYYAAKRTGIGDWDDYDEFLTSLVDYTVTNTTPDPEPEGPTGGATSSS